MDSSDELLPLSRRLDWRFLFPDPSLNRVFYSGPAGTLLSDALRRLSRDVVRGAGAQGDLAVFVNPSTRELAQVLATATSFYIELDRRAWLARALQVGAPTTYLRLARDLGFEAQAYWHYPTFDSATRIIPLSALPPLLHTVGKNSDSLKARLKTAGTSLALRTGLLARAVACLSIAGYRL